MRESDSPIERLHDELRRLNDRLGLIYDVLGEIRVDLQWALQNGRVVLHLPAEEAGDPAADPGSSNMLHLVVRLGDALIEMKNQMRDAIANAGDHHRDADEWDANDGEAESLAASPPNARAQAGPVTLESDDRESDSPRMGAASRPSCHVQRSLFDAEQPAAACERIDARGPSKDARLRDLGQLISVTGVVPDDELKRLLDVTLFDPGDAVVLDDGKDEVAEVIAVDDARNSAVIVSLRTGQPQTVSQDRLIKFANASRHCPNAGSDGECTLGEGPYTLRHFWALETRLRTGELTVEELRRAFRCLQADPEAFIAELVRESRSRVLSEWTAQFGCKVTRGRNARRRNAEAIYNAILRLFALGTVPDEKVVSNDLEAVVAAAMETITQDDIDTFARRLPGSTPVANPSFRGV